MGVRNINRLTAKQVEHAKPHPTRAVVRISDGGGLYLQVAKAGTKSWVFRFAYKGKTYEHGLGSYPEIPLASPPVKKGEQQAPSARSLAHEKREALALGIRPLSKREEHSQAVDTAASVVTFKSAALAYIEDHKGRWTNAKHVDQWTNTLTTYAFKPKRVPSIADVPVSNLTAKQIADVLRPIWTTKVETAARVRMRIKRILDWCEANEYRQGFNPARWEGSLEALLGPQPDTAKNHAALPYKSLGAFVAKLRALDGIGPLAFEFNLLTATRANEALEAKWSEFDLEDEGGPTWTIPGERMKSRKAHRVPLSKRAVEILKVMRELRDKHDYVFPSPVKKGKPLTSAALLKLAKDVTGDDAMTTHGTVRSGFTDWAAEQTNFPTGVVEAALAHVVADKTRRAYQRGDLFEKRRRLMDAWAAYCGTVQKESGRVVAFKSKTA